MKLGLFRACAACERKSIKSNLLAGASIALALTSSALADTPPFNYAGLSWSTDRYDADDYTFPISFDGRTDVMQIDIGPDGFADNRPGGFLDQFYSTQGIQAATGLPGGEAFVSVDLYIPSAWDMLATSTQDGSHQNNFYGDFTTVGLWSTILDSGTNITAYPLLRFRNAADPGTYIYAYNVDTGDNIPTAAVVNFDGWNNFRIEYRGDRLEYYFNDVLVATYVLVLGNDQTLAEDPTNTLGSIFLNVTTNNISPETYYWSALKYGVIAVAGENQTLSANLNGSIEAESTGVMTIDPGISVSGTALVKSGGTLTGGSSGNPYSISGATTVLAGGFLGGTGILAGGLMSAGTISPGNSPGILTVGNYHANAGAEVIIEVDLSAAAPVDGVTHDVFHITGNVTGVPTAVDVVQLNAPGTGIETTGNGFAVIQVDGAVSANAFQLSAPVFDGAYQYFLNYVPNYSGATDGFLLQTGIREEVWGNAAILAAGRSLLSACALREDEYTLGPSDSGRSRAWAKYVGGNMETGSDTGLEMDQDFACGAGGIDVAAGSDIRLGIAGTIGDTSIDLVTPAGMASLQGDMGAVEVYATYAPGKFFATLMVGYAMTDWDIAGPTLASGSATVDGLIVSLEGGYRGQLSEFWTLGLIGELAYDGTDCGGGCLVAGTVESTSEWQGTVSLRVDGSLADGRLLPFVTVSYSDDLDDGTSVALGTAVVSTDTASSLLGARAGLSAYMTDAIAIFVNAGVVEGTDSDVSGYDGQAGLRAQW